MPAWSFVPVVTSLNCLNKGNLEMVVFSVSFSQRNRPTSKPFRRIKGKPKGKAASFAINSPYYIPLMGSIKAVKNTLTAWTELTCPRLILATSKRGGRSMKNIGKTTNGSNIIVQNTSSSKDLSHFSNSKVFCSDIFRPLLTRKF